MFLATGFMTSSKMTVVREFFDDMIETRLTVLSARPSRGGGGRRGRDGPDYERYAFPIIELSFDKKIGQETD